jgi:hypothetical protein
MTRAARLPVLALALALFSSALGACQGLAGIEDRTYDSSAQCKAYCALAQKVCTGTSALYSSLQTCYGICALLPLGNPIEPTDDTVACRANQLMLAQSTNEPGGAAGYCAHAGPATNKACATNCQSYCTLFAEACPNQPSSTDCLTQCAGLTDTGSFDVNSNYYNDTLQCRLVHTSAATVDPTMHCPHAALEANGPCLGMDPTMVMPDCDSYCNLNLVECAGPYQVYESLDQCKAVCNALPLGTADDESGNTVACRKYHTYNAILDPVTHCPHTGPGGDGHCGSTATPDTGSTGNCESYCSLLESACSADFHTTYPGTDTVAQQACDAACAQLPDAGPDSPYSIAATGDNVSCRLLHLSRALTDATECAAAEGAAPCK